MRIAMIQDDWWPLVRGGSVHVRELSIALAEEFGHEIDIYTRSLKQGERKYTNTETYADDAVSVIRLGPCTEYWNVIGRVSSMVTPVPRLLTEEYDIIHGHTFLPAVPTRVGALLTSAASVFTVHGTSVTSGVGHDTTALANVKRRIERSFILDFKYDRVISVNEEHLGLLEAAHDNVSYVPNGVDLDRFDINRDTVEGRVLFVGRLAPKKRVNDLIEAYSNIAEEFPESELVIVGTGSMQPDLRRLAARSDAAGNIRFEGSVPDEAIPEYYASAEVFVLPSVWEGHPLTLLEAWAAGTPTIATNVEGIAEFVDHEETGYLVPPESPPDLADALRYALKNPSIARQWGNDARQLATVKYSWAKTAERTDDLYRQIA